VYFLNAIRDACIDFVKTNANDALVILKDFAPVSCPIFWSGLPQRTTLQPQELVPIHPKWNVQDWDAPSGAIDWPRLVSFLQDVRSTGEIPPDHRSHDHLNEQKDIPIGEEVAERWRRSFESLETEMKGKGERVIWGLVDGFLLYWNEVRHGSVEYPLH
jgi:hypothetical protein